MCPLTVSPSRSRRPGHERVRVHLEQTAGQNSSSTNEDSALRPGVVNHYTSHYRAQSPDYFPKYLCLPCELAIGRPGPGRSVAAHMVKLYFPAAKRVAT